MRERIRATEGEKGTITRGVLRARYLMSSFAVASHARRETKLRPMVRANRLPLVAGAVFVLGAALRPPGLSTDLQLDEVWSIQNAVAADSWFDLLRLKIDNNHHLTSMYMYALGPDTPAVVYRLLAYISGVAVVPLAWLVGSRDSPTTAVVTALLFATSAAFVFYSSEARGYATALLMH